MVSTIRQDNGLESGTNRKSVMVLFVQRSGDGRSSSNHRVFPLFLFGCSNSLARFHFPFPCIRSHSFSLSRSFDVCALSLQAYNTPSRFDHSFRIERLSSSLSQLLSFPGICTSRGPPFPTASCWP